MHNEKIYIGTYKVVRLYRISNRRTILNRGLTREQAKSIVNSYPNSSRSMVVFMKQFTQDKYFINP